MPVIKNHSRFTPARITLIFLMVLLVPAGCSSAESFEKPDANQESSAIMACDSTQDCAEKEGEEDNGFIHMNIEDFIDGYDSLNDGIYFFGFTACPWCQQLKPVLDEVSQEEDIRVGYIKTRDEDKNKTYTPEQLALLKEYFMPYQEENNIVPRWIREGSDGSDSLYVPLVLSIKDGQIVAAHQSTVEGHDAKESEMSDEQKSELKEELIEVFETQK